MKKTSCPVIIIGIAIFTIITSILGFTQITLAETQNQPSQWAAKTISIAQKAKLVPESFTGKKFTDNISREDFCELLVNASRLYGCQLPQITDNHPFKDTEKETSEQAYMLGLINGNGSGYFEPAQPLTREMAAVMLSKMRMLFYYTDAGRSLPENDSGDQSSESDGSLEDEGEVSDNENIDLNLDGTNINSESGNWNAYSGNYVTKSDAGVYTYTTPVPDYEADWIMKGISDSGKMSKWARTYMADLYSRGVLGGTDGNQISPGKNLTVEQAVVLVLHLIAYCDNSRLRDAGVEECVLAAPAGTSIGQHYYKGNILIDWTETPSAAAYSVKIYKKGNQVYSATVTQPQLDLQANVSVGSNGAETYSFTSDLKQFYYTVLGSNKQEAPVVIHITPLDQAGRPSVFSFRRQFTISPWFNENEMIYGNPWKSRFDTPAQASMFMTRVKVKVWSLTAKGIKTTKTISLTVNKNQVDTVRKIFAEIYNGKERFPIKTCASYDFRNGTSQHSAGVAIDINPEENYFLSWDGRITAGKLWQPHKNPYSITPNGDVVRAFNKYGWNWSPDMNRSNGADYMHFSLTGR